MLRALKRVRANKGAPGVDGMTVDQLPAYLKRHWPKIRRDLLDGRYQPLPVRRKEIPKPSGGVRLLGIPAALDRLIQQAVAQVLQQIWDPTFSDSSFGFRPGRSQHDALKQAKELMVDGGRHIVDMDLAKFFDTVNHDRLMSRLATRVNDKRVLKLVRRFLTAGVMIGGLVSPTSEGTPQGGPLSPLLSNIVLDELDKELEKRDPRFVRYIEKRLRLEVNREKRVVGHPLAWGFNPRKGRFSDSASPAVGITRRFASTRNPSSGLNSGFASSPAGVVG